MPRFSLEDIGNARPENPERLAGTTEEEIQRQIAEDGGFDMGAGGAASAMATGAPCSKSTGRRL